MRNHHSTFNSDDVERIFSNIISIVRNISSSRNTENNEKPVQRSFNVGEMEQILSNIIKRKSISGSDISLEELISTAKELGISEEELYNEISLINNENNYEILKKEFIKERRGKFYNHLASYTIVNGFLVALDLLVTSGISFSLFPILGWGVGLAFDFKDTFFPTKKRIQKGVERLKRLKEKMRRKKN